MYIDHIAISFFFTRVFTSLELFLIAQEIIVHSNG